MIFIDLDRHDHLWLGHEPVAGRDGSPGVSGPRGCPEGSGGPLGTIWEVWGPPSWSLVGPQKKLFILKKGSTYLFEAHQPQIWKHILK